MGVLKVYDIKFIIVREAWPIDGCPQSIRHQVYNSSWGLAHGWVSSKGPNPTRDNGLLIMVVDEHFGEYVRRIHQRYVYYEENGSKKAVIILAVVKNSKLQTF